MSRYGATNCKICAFLAIFALVPASARISLYINGTRISGSHPAITHDFWGSKKFNITAPIVRLDPNTWGCSNACPKFEGHDAWIEGKIVIGSDDEWGCRIAFLCGERAFAEELKAAGSLGMIYFKRNYNRLFTYTTGSYSRIMYAKEYWNQNNDVDLSQYAFVHGTSVGPLDTYYEDIPRLISQCYDQDCDAAYYVEMISGDSNQWHAIWDGPWWIFQIVFSIVATYLMIFAGQRLYRFIQEEQGVRLSIPQLALAAEVLTNFFRLCSSIDHLYVRGIYDWAGGSFVATASMPFQQTSTLLTLVLLFNILGTYGLIPRPFKVTEGNVIVAGSILFVIFAIELCMALGRSFFGLNSPTVLAFNALVYSTVNLVLAIVFYVMGSSFIKYRRRLDHRTKESKRTIDDDSELSKHVMSSAFFMIVSVVAIFATGVLLFHPTGRLLSVTLLLVGMTGTSFFQISAFAPLEGKTFLHHKKFREELFRRCCLSKYLCRYVAGQDSNPRNKIIPFVNYEDGISSADRAMTIACIRYFCETYSVDTSLTVEEIAREYIATLAAKQSSPVNGITNLFTELCEKADESVKGVPMIGHVDFYVSHCEKCRFSDLIDVLVEFERASKSSDGTAVYFWIPMFATNTHVSSTVARFQHVRDAIANSKAVLSVLTPWNRPRVMRDSWCLFEAMTALQNNVPQRMILPPDEEKRFFVALNQTYESVIDCVNCVESKYADCRFESDKWIIRSLIERQFGSREHVEQYCKKLKLEVNAKSIPRLEGFQHSSLKCERRVLRKEQLRHLDALSGKDFSVDDRVIFLNKIAAGGNRDDGDGVDATEVSTSTSSWQPGRIVGLGKTKDHFEVLFTSRSQWMAKQSPNYFLRRSVEGIVDGKHIRWDHVNRVLSNVSSGDVLYRLNDAYYNFDEILKQGLTKAMQKTALVNTYRP